MKIHKLIVSSILISLYGCGGSDSNTAVSTETGVFLDSPVINIGYRTETQSGVTNSLGEYNYITGETVTFFIGDLELPSAPATEVVTPLELAGTQDILNSTVVNIIRLLQTLDKNGNPSDGITITDAAIAAATQVDFSLDEASFESSSSVANFIPNISDLDTPVTTLINTTVAIANFNQGLDDAVSIDMTQKTANSVITFSECPGVPLGWNYTFTSTSMTLTGSDTWQTPACTTSAQESMTFDMTAMISDFDIPFNCATYPVCKSTDFNKTLSGVDGDNRNFTSTYSFDRLTNVLTYVKTVGITTYTEVITLVGSVIEPSVDGGFTADWIQGKTLYTVILDTQDDDNDGSTTDWLLVAAKYENGIRSLDFSADGVFEVTTGITYSIVNGVLTISEGVDTERETITAVDSTKLTVSLSVSWGEPDSTMFEFFTKADATAYMLTLP